VQARSGEVECIQLKAWRWNSGLSEARDWVFEKGRWADGDEEGGRKRERREREGEKRSAQGAWARRNLGNWRWRRKERDR